LGVARQLAGRAFRFNLFSDEKSLKSISASIPNAHRFTILDFRFTIYKIA